MALGTSLALLMLAQGPAQIITPAEAPAADQVDVAYEELVSGKDSAAISRIETNDALEAEDPARLINLGVAYARQGDEDTARSMFAQVARNETRYRLETAQGEWVDSRQLARRALGMLDRGEFTNARIATR